MTIEAIHSHLNAGNEIAIVTYGHCTVLTKKHVEYIRASKDGKGYYLGWPGKKSVFTFSYSVKFVPAGMTMGRR